MCPLLCHGPNDTRWRGPGFPALPCARQPDALSGKTLQPFTTAPPPSSAACSRRGSTTYIAVGVDSSLRWNDDRGRNGFVTIPIAPLPCLADYLTSTPSSFRRRPESSGLDQPFPQCENDNRNDNRTRHLSRPRLPDSVVYIIHSRTAGMTTREFSGCLSVVILGGLQPFIKNNFRPPETSNE